MILASASPRARLRPRLIGPIGGVINYGSYPPVGYRKGDPVLRPLNKKPFISPPAKQPPGGLYFKKKPSPLPYAVATA